MVIRGVRPNSKELGVKYTCDCGARYYTFGRPKPTCPKCGTPAVVSDAPRTALADEVHAEEESDDDRRSRLLGGIDDDVLAMVSADEDDDDDVALIALDEDDGDLDGDADEDEA